MALIAVGLLASCAGNDAQQGSSRWVPDFAEATGATLYCGNGAAESVSNERDWYEWTLLADGEPDERAAELIEALAANGYHVEASPGSPVEYGEHDVLNDEEYLEAMNWATSWIRLDATRPDGFTAFARVADGVTLTNCFPDAGDVITAADPHAADVVTVLMFRGPSS